MSDQELLTSLPYNERVEARVRAVGQAGETIAHTRFGVVHMLAVDPTEDGKGVVVELADPTESGETRFVVVNPPTLVEDPAGERLINGVRFRHDPLHAVAEAVARHGGAATAARKRRITQ